MRPVALFLVIIFAAASCKTLQSAAAKDPMKCERDPKCTNRYEKSRDCATQCADDYECMKRCESIQQGIDRMP